MNAPSTDPAASPCGCWAMMMPTSADHEQSEEDRAHDDQRIEQRGEHPRADAREGQRDRHLLRCRDAHRVRGIGGRGRGWEPYPPALLPQRGKGSNTVVRHHRVVPCGGALPMTLPSASVTSSPLLISSSTRGLPHGSCTTAQRPICMSKGGTMIAPPASTKRASGGVSRMYEQIRLHRRACRLEDDLCIGVGHTQPRRCLRAPDERMAQSIAIKRKPRYRGSARESAGNQPSESAASTARSA